MFDTDSYWVLFRHPTDKQTTLFETDDLGEATFVLQGAVINPDAQLIDYSYSLDGTLDELLKGVRLSDTVAA